MDKTLAIDNTDITARSTVSDLDVRLFPNPATNYINIEMSTTNLEGIRLTMYNEAGQLMHQMNTDQSKLIIDVTPDKFTSGLYMILIQQGNDDVITKRVIIAK